MAEKPTVSSVLAKLRKKKEGNPLSGLDRTERSIKRVESQDSFGLLPAGVPYPGSKLAEQDSVEGGYKKSYVDVLKGQNTDAETIARNKQIFGLPLSGMDSSALKLEPEKPAKPKSAGETYHDWYYRLRLKSERGDPMTPAEQEQADRAGIIPKKGKREQGTGGPPVYTKRITNNAMELGRYAGIPTSVDGVPVPVPKIIELVKAGIASGKIPADPQITSIMKAIEANMDSNATAARFDSMGVPLDQGFAYRQQLDTIYSEYSQMRKMMAPSEAAEWLKNNHGLTVDELNEEYDAVHPGRISSQK
ncbi:MAG TPA: hypothetical protein VLH39_05360 [Magnetospirillaceae bacterium]|nr:hypothetical protein [Magnetospirillaceae bacterium]